VSNSKVGKARIEDLPGTENSDRFEGHTTGSSVSVFLSHHKPGTGPGLHTHPYEETFFVFEGDVLFTVDGEEIEARDGDIVVVPANTPHKFLSRGERLRQFSVHPVPRMEQENLQE
jgi:quercetin dioxygenase-like cupin family protein